MTFVRRILTLGATTLAAVALASPALAHDSNSDGEVGTSGHDHTYVACANGQPVERVSPDKEPSEGNVDCDADYRAEQEKRRQEEEKRQQEEARAREEESQRRQQVIGREQAEADNLEAQAKLCDRQPSACSPHGSVNSSASPAKAALPKPVSHVATRQEKVARYGNPAGVEVRPVAEQPQDEGLEDAIDVPETHGFSLIDPALRPGPRNMVWFSIVAMAAISSLGYGLWRILFVGDV